MGDYIIQRSAAALGIISSNYGTRDVVTREHFHIRSIFHRGPDLLQVQLLACCYIVSDAGTYHRPLDITLSIKTSVYLPATRQDRIQVSCSTPKI